MPAQSTCVISRHPPSGPVARLGGEALGAYGRNVPALVEQRLEGGRPRYFRYLLARLRSREDAEDALQDFTVKALRGARRVRVERIDSWLNVSLRNALFDRYRRTAARRRLIDAAAAEPTDCGAQEIVEELSSLDCLAKSVSELKPSYATVLRRADLDEASISDLACELGLTSNNAAVRLHRARKMLRGIMQTRCSSCPTPCQLATRFISRAALI